MGYTPICQCMPALQQLEKRVDKDKEHIYEHIDASHQILKNRMDQLHKRTTHQISSYDQWSRTRFDEEETNCYNRIDQRMGDQQHYMAHRNQGRINVDNWLEAKLSEYGHCLDHHHDDSALPSNNIFTDIHETENGRLFRSRSDETLSQSDNHSGKFRKRQFYESRQQAMQQIRGWQLPAYSKERTYRYTKPVTGRRENHNVQNPQTFNRNTNQQSVRQNITSPVTSQQNTRSSSRPEFISPSTVSTSRSPYMSHDPVYGSHYSGYDKGAIPKRLPTSQTWHGANELQAAVLKETSPLNHNSTHELRSSGYREASPLNHSTLKSRESSPYDYHYLPPQRMVKSRTEPENLTPRQGESRNIQSEMRNKSETRNSNSESRNIKTEIGNKSETQNPQSESRNIHNDNRMDYYQRRHVEPENFKNENFDRQNEVRRSHTEAGNFHNEKRHSETRRSFPERGSSNTSTGTNMTSNSSSTGQGPLTESNTGKSSRPTFTTFGYPEKEHKPYNSEESTAVQNSNSVHQSESTYGYYNRIGVKPQIPEPYNNFNTKQGEKQIPSGYRMTTTQNYEPHNVNNTVRNSATHSINSQNRDDMYISSPNQNMQMSRQRSRSSEGILLDDELTSAHQMKQKVLNQNVQRSATPNSPRSGQGQNYNVPLETVKRSMPQYGSARSFSRERIDQNPRTFQSDRNLQNSQYHSASQGNVSRNVGQIYNSMRDVPTDGCNGGHINYSRDRPYRAGDSTYRENPYGVVKNLTNKTNETRNQTPVRPGNNYSTYNSDIKGDNKSVYSEHSNVPRIISKSELTLDQPNCVQDQSLSPRDNDRNLQSTPIQDKSKEDNSSNPDSGYSSKIFGRNVNSAHVPSTSDTPSSSFSTEPTDHNMTLSSNNSPHPQVNHSDYAQINTVRHQYDKDLSNHVQQWYHRKLKDGAKNLSDEQYDPHGEYHSQSPQNPKDYSKYEYVQPSRQIPYHGNQMYSTYQQVPNYIRGSDV